MILILNFINIYLNNYNNYFNIIYYFSYFEKDLIFFIGMKFYFMKF